MNFLPNEALLEPVARWLRFSIGFNYLSYLSKVKTLEVADLGCGPEIRFFKYCQQRQHLIIKQYYGVDPLITARKKSQLEKITGVSIVTKPLIKKINLPSNSVNAIVGFAFLEHIDYPQEIVRDALRVLKPGGLLILTTPTPLAKFILEFLAFQLHVISEREIAEHQRYFWQADLIKLLPTKFKPARILHRYFELGLNNLLVVIK